MSLWDSRVLRPSLGRFRGTVRGRLGRVRRDQEVVEFFKAFVSDPENVDTGFVAVKKPAYPPFFTWSDNDNTARTIEF
jgi:hypothetical protein